MGALSASYLGFAVCVAPVTIPDHCRKAAAGCVEHSHATTFMRDQSLAEWLCSRDLDFEADDGAQTNRAKRGTSAAAESWPLCWLRHSSSPVRRCAKAVRERSVCALGFIGGPAKKFVRE